LRRAVVVVAVVGLLALGGWLLANSSVVALRYVTVEGTSRLTVVQVLAAADVREGSSLVRLDTTAIARRVDTLAPVERAVVTRKWPHGLVIRVTERTAAAVAIGPGGAVLLDSTGVAFAPVASPPAGMLHVEVDAALPGAAADAARAGMRVLAELPARLRRSVEIVQAPSPDAITIHLRDGRIVVWGSPEESSRKAAVLRVLLRTSARVYDVSTPSVAVTRS
jgi:cell division protein FtsQ